jgi:hypothetical protein
MSTPRRTDEPTPLSQRELDILKVLTPVLQGQRNQIEAARLLDITPRQVRRRGGGRGCGPEERGRQPWRTVGRRALGLHSCRALSSGGRGGR